MTSILLFDDIQEELDQIKAELNNILRNSTEVVDFSPNSQPSGGESYDQYVSDWIEELAKTKDVGLIACDKELGRYRTLPGFSATPVSAVAQQKGIPFCQYSRQAGDEERDFANYNRLQRWSSEEITLEGIEPKSWAGQIAALFQGFQTIRNEYQQGLVARTPAAALATILGRADEESRISLFGSGGQGFLIETLAFYDPEAPDKHLVTKRMPRVLGNWLYLSILRFPGIVLNEVAAASYLNINETDFANPAVQALFQDAKYKGPFWELGPWWWRSLLDQNLDEAESDDGKEIAAKHDIEVAECLDPDNGARSGFYCMLTRKPVSLENSRGGISWFPAGADLARIRKDKFDEITALVGMY